ncbi:iron-sulfur cluster assembly scaffold protein [Candidatus Beckwithbacteria bacterium CG10_big_fil_rev_8_21_14_0_10_34_10]|uniref:Iron-sulfur cluster assembly scaffold protein n=1 Tax=Candidatus Beckwithbacteria bacterium CG10_big_fil_rev_8_21_14_0_10_34_10 TaxID=1974495 RepID=A0A2H0W999_9BACT|nr:MAG: iron-sulfur cluster assembly scaffold protein [Candidatus Beckwithbacteria bacterium CG10_big_fil_rev_8_21_14_0_10_34_10]
MSLYSQKVLRHFRHPQNMGEMKNPDSKVQVGNPVCGDVMQMYLKIDKNKNGKEYIKDIKFQTLGCAAAIAVSSISTELVKGETLVEAEKLNSQKVIKSLEGLPKPKIHCSLLAIKAIKKAILNYKSRTIEKAKAK